MRSAFIKTLTELADRDPRIVLLTGDLGFQAIEPFVEAHPTRFFNVGIAEQNMVGVATGLADAGMIPFVYSIVPFAALRPYEFIRNSPGLATASSTTSKPAQPRPMSSSSSVHPN